MPLLVPRVLGDEMQVFAPDHQRAVHFGGHDGAGEDPAADRDEAGEGAFLVWFSFHVLVHLACL